MDYVACQGPLSMGFPRQEYQTGLSLPIPEDLPDPGIEPTSPALAGRFFTSEPLGKSQRHHTWHQKADPVPLGFLTAFRTLAFDPVITVATASLSSAGICNLSQSSRIWARSPSHTASFCDFRTSSCSKESQWLQQWQRQRESWPSGFAQRYISTPMEKKHFHNTVKSCVFMTSENKLYGYHYGSRVLDLQN